MSPMIDDASSDDSTSVPKRGLPSFLMSSSPVGVTAPMQNVVSQTAPQTYTAQPAPAYRLFKPGGIGWATALASPLAGAILMMINYRRLGLRKQARNTLI